MINGSIDADGKTLNKKDALGIKSKGPVKIKAFETAEVLAIEVPMLTEEN